MESGFCRTPLFLVFQDNAFVCFARRLRQEGEKSFVRTANRAGLQSGQQTSAQLSRGKVAKKLTKNQGESLSEREEYLGTGVGRRSPYLVGKSESGAGDSTRYCVRDRTGRRAIRSFASLTCSGSPATIKAWGTKDAPSFYVCKPKENVHDRHYHQARRTPCSLRR